MRLSAEKPDGPNLVRNALAICTFARIANILTRPPIINAMKAMQNGLLIKKGQIFVTISTLQIKVHLLRWIMGKKISSKA